MRLLLFLLCCVVVTLRSHGKEFDDSKGYVVYCPCMGRFGNQVEQFLGSLAFARAIGRNLVLPPFVEYDSDEPQAKMIDFTRYFSLTMFDAVHPVVPMKRFMKEIAPRIWPEDQRKVFCWTPRASVYEKEAAPGCHAKEGNPFGPFWDHSRINFVEDIYYGSEIQGGFDVSTKENRKQWLEKYPPSEYPVLAFSSAPAPFPTRENDRHLQQYLRWAPSITSRATEFIKENLVRPYIGIHLRNDIDWDRVCEHVQEGVTNKLFASAQCLGDYGEKGSLTKEMCGPSLSTILEDVETIARRIGAKSVFVSSDREHYIDELTEHLKPLKVSVHRLNPDDAHVSLVILGRADHFIGNCVSTFSSFVTRERKYANRIPQPTSFFGFHPEVTKRRKIEL